MATSKLCSACNAKIQSNNKFCPECGASIQNTDFIRSEKSAVTALLLCLFLGSLGVHRFYVGKIGTGILMLLTAGGFGIWTLIDLIRIACCDFKDNKGRYLIFTRGPASPLKLILIIVGCVFGALLVYIAFILALVFYLTSPMTNTIQAQLSALRAHDLDKAYSYMADESITKTNKKEFIEYMAAFPIMQNNKGATFNETSIENNQGMAKGTLLAPNGKKVRIEYALVKEGNTWKIFGLRISKNDYDLLNENPTLKIYANKVDRFTVLYPSDWTFKELDKHSVIFNGEGGYSSVRPSILIQVLPIKMSANATKKSHLAMNDLKRQISLHGTNIKFLDAGLVELPSNPKKFHGEYIVFTYTDNKGNARKQMQFVLSSDDKKAIYSFSYTNTADLYNRDLPIAKTMYESWKIE